MNSAETPNILSALLSRGIAFSWGDGEIGCTHPIDVSLDLALSQSGVQDADLAAELSRRMVVDASTEPVVAAGPPSPGQERLLRSRALLSDHDVLIKPTTIMIEGSLEQLRLCAAMDKVICRFSALRAQFRLRGDGTYVQTISAPEEGSLELIDLSDKSDSMAALVEALRQMTNRPFGILDPYIRTALFRLNERTHCLAVSIHHMVSDVWSVGLFYEALAEAYQNPEYAELPTKISANRYFEAIRTVQSKRCSAQGQAGLDYWVELLSSAAAPLKWKHAPPGATVVGLQFKDCALDVDADLLARFGAHTCSTGISRGQFLLAAWALTLRAFAENERISIGVMAACRTSSAVETEMGFFSNPIVFPADFSDPNPLSKLVEKFSDQMIRTLEHQDVPLQDIVGRLYQIPGVDVERLYQAMFAYNNVPVTELKLENMSCQEFDPTVADLRAELSTIDVRLSLTPVGGGLRGIITYKADVFDEALIDEMKRVFKSMLIKISSQSSVDWRELMP